mmetsp:Transcript_21794/g.56809  ORF Transcript_21794/g.56809 Transcript_21794/m.56809 type:complete len:444 (-) Transcript_21794:155-1486(-)
MAALATVVALGAVGVPIPANVSLLDGLYTRTTSYFGQQVVKCEVDGMAAAALERLSTEYDVFAVRGTSMHIRAETAAARAEIEAMVPSGSCETLVADLEGAAVAFEADLVASRPQFTSVRTRRQAGSWHASYHRYDEIKEWYTTIADEFPLITKLVPSIGKSGEGRDMPAFHITGTSAITKKKIYFQCQIHAREWISGATCMYIVDHLTSNYGVEDEVTKLLDQVELIVIPFTNPDGYEFTWTGSRLWRKNRSPPPERSTCYGTDLNRNYDDHWGQGGSSTNPCSDTYMGTKANSEPETQHTTDYFTENAPIYGAIDWHSYSQLILRPYGWTSNDAPDEKLLKEVGDAMRDDAEKVHGMRYTSQKSISLYPTTGTANDWFYGTVASRGNKGLRAYGFTVELRDTGRYGFELPADQIIPQGQEMIPAAMKFMSFCIENPLYFQG